MGILNMRSGRLICEKFGISVLKLAELCHKGHLKAYSSEDWRPILASSQCNTKFKFTDNTSFFIMPSSSNSIVAIGEEAKFFLNVHVERIVNECKNQEVLIENGNKITALLVAASNKWESMRLSNIRELQITRGNNKYFILYDLYASQISSCSTVKTIKFYRNNLVFFELKENECEADLEYIEMKSGRGGGIMGCTTKLCLKKIRDDYGNSKYILLKYDDRLIKIVTDLFVGELCGVFFDSTKQKNDAYVKKCNSWYAYLQQYAVDYFDKEDDSYLKPLKLEDDFFIFEYEEYKKRFKFLEDDTKLRKVFFGYIEKLVFDEGEIEKAFAYEIAINAIMQDPRKYMIDRCIDLEKDNFDSDTIEVIRAYRMAVEQHSWKAIHEKIWSNRTQGLPCNDKYISTKLDKFRSIAISNRIPYIKAGIFKKMGEDNKEKIIQSMILQLEKFYLKVI